MDDITVEDVKTLTLELYLAQRDRARLQQENAHLRQLLAQGAAGTEAGAEHQPHAHPHPHPAE